MPKLKTKSSCKKRFRLTASGKIRRPQAKKQHGMMKLTKKQVRNLRGGAIMAASDAQFVRKMMPYG